MNDEISWGLIGKFLFGECTEAEEARIHDWIEQDPSRKALLEHLRQILWMTDDSAESREWDTEELWERIDEETRRDDTERELGTSARAPSKRSRLGSRIARQKGRRPSLRTTIWTGAASMLVAVVLGLWLFGPLETGLEQDDSSGPKTFVTDNGQRAIVRLTDGTRVRLNVDSKLIVSQSFGSDSRDVRLRGEAFFEVVSDSTRPFRVRTGEAVTRVLGTKFDVSAYPEDNETRVVVAEGRVAMQPEGDHEGGSDTDREEVVLERQEMGQILDSGEYVIRRDLDVTAHLAWMDGQLAFDDASFEHVVRKLERWYGLEISLREGQKAPGGHLNARFAKDQPVPEVLGVVSTAFGMEYTRDDNEVVLAPRG